MLVGAACAATALLSACSSTPSTSTTSSSAPASSSQSASASATGPAVALPAAFVGKPLVSPAVVGYPPYAYVQNNKIVGIDADLSLALSGPFGQQVTLKEDSFENSLLGLNRGVYFMASGTDITAARLQKFDFVSYLEDHYAFLTLSSSPTMGTDMMALCGLKISTVAADSSIPILKAQSDACTKAGKQPVTVLTFADQGAATLAVKSKQADATTATVTNLGYVAKQSNGEFKMGGPTYSYVYIGIATAKGNGMAQAIADAINILIKNGEYGKILARYGVQDAAVSQALVNPNPTPTPSP